MRFTVAVLWIALLAGLPAGAARAGEAPAAEAPEPERPAMIPEAGTSTLSPDEEITPALRRAAERGLAYLAETQSRDGGWGAGGARYGRGGPGSQSAMTGLAGLAFLAGGHTPGRGEYGKNVSRAVEWVIRNTDNAGVIRNMQSPTHGAMYGHGFACLFLAEVYGMTGDRRVKRSLQKSVKLMVRCQNPQGGWRYNPTPQSADLSVTVCQIQALRAARNAGIKVPEKTIQKSISYLKKSACPDGSFAYTIGSSRGSLALTGAGVTSLCGLGLYELPQIRKAGKRLMREVPKGRKGGRGGYGHYFYTHYYCAQAAYQLGGSYWAKWFPAIRKELVGSQAKDGSWADGAGPNFGTAMACIILQIPYRYLPILQR